MKKINYFIFIFLLAITTHAKTNQILGKWHAKSLGRVLTYFYYKTPAQLIFTKTTFKWQYTQKKEQIIEEGNYKIAAPNKIDFYLKRVMINEENWKKSSKHYQGIFKVKNNKLYISFYEKGLQQRPAFLGDEDSQIYEKGHSGVQNIKNNYTDKIIFSVSPYLKSEYLSWKYLPLTQFLSQSLKKEVRFTISLDNHHLITDLQKGIIHFAVVPPLIYKKYKDKFNYLLSIKTKETNHFNYVIFTRNDHKIKNKKDLKTKVLLAADHNAASYLSLKKHFKNKKTFKKVLFMGCYKNILDSVYQKKVDCGLVSKRSFNLASYFYQGKNKLVTYKEIRTKPYPIIIVSKKKRALFKKLKKAFLVISKNSLILNRLGASGFF